MASDAAALAQDGPHVSREAVLFVDGQLHDIEIVKVKLADADGAPAGIVGLSTDVTERLRKDAEVNESRARLAGIIGSAMDAIISVDEAQRVILFNRAAEDMFRVAAAAVVGQPLERLIPERFREGHRQHLRGFAATGMPTRMEPERLCALRSDGEEFPCEASISRIEVGGRRLLTVILRDVSDRERAEATRRELEERSRQAQQMEALGTLAGGIAHDFNNLLSIIMLNAEMALGRDQRREECMRNIVNAGERARDLVRRILAFSRRQPQARAVIDLRAALDEAIRLIRSTLPASVELAVVLDPDSPAIVADATEVHQIVVNLCTNAWHAIEEKGAVGRIEVATAPVELDRVAAAAHGLAPGRHLRLTVTDDGQGMDAATAQRAFDPFFTTKGPGRGTGLGLSLVHTIVTEMHGVVEVASRPGAGTTITLLVPATTAEATAAATAAGPVEAAAESARVLYLDDEEMLLTAATHLLERAGFRVASCNRPTQALALLRAKGARFDVVVADVNMPEMSGLMFASEVARLHPALPIVLTSGNVTAQLEIDAERIGVREVLEKPYAIAALRDLLRRLTRGRAAASTHPAP